MLEIVSSLWWLWLAMYVCGLPMRFVSKAAAENVGRSFTSCLVLLSYFLGWANLTVGSVLFVLAAVVHLIDYAKA